MGFIFVAMYLTVGFFSLMWLGREYVSSALTQILQRAHLSRKNKPLILSLIMLILLAIVVGIFTLLLVSVDRSAVDSLQSPDSCRPLPQLNTV